MSEDTSLFQEIDESLRADNMEKFLRCYGKLLIAACVAIVVATAGSVFWKSHVRDVNIKRTDALLEAGDLIGAGKYADAQKKLEILNQNDATIISRLMLAEVLIDQGQADKAVAAFNEAGNNTSNVAFRALSSMNAYIVGNNHNLTAQKDSTETLKNLYEGDNPFVSIAGELYALQLQKSGKSKEAKNVLGDISHNPSLSMAQRVQAKEILESLEKKP